MGHLGQLVGTRFHIYNRRIHLFGTQNQQHVSTASRSFWQHVCRRRKHAEFLWVSYRGTLSAWYQQDSAGLQARGRFWTRARLWRYEPSFLEHRATYYCWVWEVSLIYGTKRLLGRQLATLARRTLIRMLPWTTRSWRPLIERAHALNCSNGHCYLLEDTCT
jgi:hypothetical protein